MSTGLFKLKNCISIEGVPQQHAAAEPQRQFIHIPRHPGQLIVCPSTLHWRRHQRQYRHQRGTNDVGNYSAIVLLSAQTF